MIWIENSAFKMTNRGEQSLCCVNKLSGIEQEKHEGGGGGRFN